MSRVDPPVNVRGRSSNHVSGPNRRAYTRRVLPRTRGAAAASPARFRKTRDCLGPRRARRSSAPATKAKPGRRIILHQPMRDAARDVVWRARCRAARRDRAKYAFFQHSFPTPRGPDAAIFGITRRSWVSTTTSSADV